MSLSQTAATTPPRGSARPARRGVHLVLALIALALVGLALAVKTWGMVALTMAALPFVPVMFIIFIWISLP